jgi:uroporphyrinogen-III synthase
VSASKVRPPSPRKITTRWPVTWFSSGSASLDGLLTLAGPAAPQLKALPLAVLGAALADHARQAGFQGPILPAGEASDAGLVSAVRALLGSPTPGKIRP